MTSTQPRKIKSNEENLKQLLEERIAQLESREEDPPRSPDEQAAEDAFQVAASAVRALVADAEISPDEKVRVLQAMFTDCISNVRALEYDLGIEEKRLSVLELDYSELGEDLRKIEALTDKLKTLSRELSKQNKTMIEDSKKRTAEERSKREEIVAKFDEALKDINARLTTDDSVQEERDDAVTELEANLDQLQAQYDDREVYYKQAVDEATADEKRECELLARAREEFERDELALVTERRKLINLRKKSRKVGTDIDMIDDRRKEIEEQAREREEGLKRQSGDVKRLEQSRVDLGKAMTKLGEEREELREKGKEAMIRVKADEDEVEFWRAKSKAAVEKREMSERLCRTLTEERQMMRKEVHAMQAVWSLLEREIENLRLEITESPKT
eukprot:GFKZ01010899.1.p1 GENE.GFKZ01010899.1~~GFKZ01010899.1.p1  ORF type:complete len:389 (-),score=110.59 GFKZ01010899.1:740-1906(-)